ncbi:Uncharacterised protein [Vibrio cholerae]|nr:Uncharacterised protein [Vibrio cholerae]
MYLHTYLLALHPPRQWITAKLPQTNAGNFSPVNMI